nr:L,D-transpeptidase [Tianweitania populi]
MSSRTHTASVRPAPRVVPAYYQEMYAAKLDEAYPVAAADLTKVEPEFYRQEVDYPTYEPAGTIVVDTQARHLYLVGTNGRALRYGIGVGKAGLAFEGTARIQYKREWPRWTPTQDMMTRDPERYGHLADGMEPGPTNPLGPRALYLFKDGVDTLFRIHGTTEDWSIGRAVSSGCIRLLNADIIDLYSRVPSGTRVVVLQGDSDPVV